jgi:hypothetical protein
MMKIDRMYKIYRMRRKKTNLVNLVNLVCFRRRVYEQPEPARAIR